MNSSIRIFTQAMSACFVLLLFTSVLCAQTNTFPLNPPVGIGTQLDGGSLNALQIHYDSMEATSMAMIRLSEGTSTSNVDFGLLGLMPKPDTIFSSLSKGADLILHENRDGDVIITNYWAGGALAQRTGGAIRLATAGDTTVMPSPAPAHHDFERLTIMDNGNVGIDLPSDTSSSFLGLDSARDQLQIGGGSAIPPPLIDPGYLDPIPGLTIYGGNPLEGTMQRGGGTYPLDWRGISFNSWTDHTNPSSSRYYRFARMASSSLSFAESAGGLVNLSCFPYSSTLGQNDFSKHLTLQLTGNEGLQLWYMDTIGNTFHHLFDVYMPTDAGLGIRNTNGLSFFHTPLCISSDSSGQPLLDFTNLTGLYPDIGDDTTWMLVVNGPELAKEIFVLDSSWADYVFEPNFKLRPLSEVENYTKENHHLPDIPSAKQMAKTGVPVGRTEAAITKQLEEEMLYIEQLNHKIDELESEVQELKNQKEK